MQRGAVAHGLDQHGRLDTKSAACNLDEVLMARAVGGEHQVDAAKPLAPVDASFYQLSVTTLGDDGNDAALDEIRVGDALLRFEQDQVTR